MSDGGADGCTNVCNKSRGFQVKVDEDKGVVVLLH